MLTRHPKIVTDAKIPCAVFAGRLDTKLSVTDVERIFGNIFTTVDNVYNRKAYFIDSNRLDIICIDEDKEVSLICLLNDEIKLNSEMELDALKSKASNGVDMIQKTLSTDFNGAFRFERFWVEETGKNPN